MFKIDDELGLSREGACLRQGLRSMMNRSKVYDEPQSASEGAYRNCQMRGSV